MPADSLWCPTRIVSGRSITTSVVAAAIGDGPALLVADAELHPDAERWPVRDVLLVRGAAIATVRSVAERIRSRRPAAVIAFGGGSVLDAAKIAVAVGADAFPAFSRQLDRGGVQTRRGLRSREPRLIAVPTTIGTAAEVSPVACVTTATGHRLVVGDDLRPSLAVLDAQHLASLPPRLVMEGALEALLRVAGAAASGTLTPHAFAESVLLGRRILAAAAGVLVDDGADARGRLALLSAETRYSWSAHPADRYALRHWYPANELAFTAGLGKTAATLTVLPEVWRRMLNGDTRLGDGAALLRFWRALRPGSRPAPPEDVLALAAEWRIPPPAVPTTVQRARAAEATAAVWLGPHRALAGWDTDLVAGVLGTDPTPGRRSAPPRLHAPREEVNT